jgi:hypothetical protein
MWDKKTDSCIRCGYGVIVACACVLGACNGKHGRRIGKTAPRTGGKTVTRSTGGRVDVSGVWDWRLALQTDDGDWRVERESWVLKQTGKAVKGGYTRVVTSISRDGQPFQCNNDKTYTLEARFKIKGKIKDGKLHLTETAVEVKPSPCEKGKRRLDSYVGRLQDGRIVLDWGQGKQTLQRRRLTGIWKWTRKRRLPNGDTAVTTEHWHLAQRGDVVRGRRFRHDLRVSNDKKRFRCNGRLKMGRYAAWSFQGSVQGRVAEVTFGAPRVKASPCETRDLKQAAGKLKLEAAADELNVELSDAQFTLTRAGGLTPVGAVAHDAHGGDGEVARSAPWKHNKTNEGARGRHSAQTAVAGGKGTGGAQ